MGDIIIIIHIIENIKISNKICDGNIILLNNKMPQSTLPNKVKSSKCIREVMYKI